MAADDSKVQGIDLTNQFLIAMPGMADDHFQGAVVYLCEHNERGALGLVINRPVELKLAHLFERIDLNLGRPEMRDDAVLFGGPVQTERGFVLHDRLVDEGTTYTSTLSIQGGLEMTTSRDVLEAMSEGAGPRRVIVTLGYAGWSAGQLEEELGRNGWLTVEADHTVIFDTPIEERYDRALSLLGINRAVLSAQAGHA